MDKHLQDLVRELFDKYLNYVEESDSGKLFHPITITCCRVMMTQPLNELLKELQRLSGAKPNPLEKRNANN